MKRRGRLSLEWYDRSLLVQMASIWTGPRGQRSVRSISLKAAVKARGYGTHESKAKRLERRFLKLHSEGQMLPICAYRQRDLERLYSAQKLGLPAFGPFSTDDLADPNFRIVDLLALAATAQLLDLSPKETEQLAAQGLEILRDWFPARYPDWRI